MLKPISRDKIRTLLGDQKPPCISIYLPTHRHHPGNQQDPIRYKNLLRSAEESLAREYSGREMRPVLDRLNSLSVNQDFWNHTLDGLAIFAAADRFEVLPTQRTMPELAVVAKTFHVKPLLRHVQSAERVQVLALSRHTASMHEGNRDVMDALDTGDMPVTITEALGDQLTAPHQTVASYGGVGSPMHHGHGSRRDEIDKDAERFFRFIDREVTARFSRPSGLPLVLVALGEHHAMFRAVSQNPFLMGAAVDTNPEARSIDLRERVWSVIEPAYRARLAKLGEDFGAAAANGRGSADLADVARAAVAGRVGTLLLEADRVVPGRLNRTDGSFEVAELGQPDVDDLHDDVAEVVLRHGGEVVIIPKDRMTGDSGIAAVYRH